ncbi:MAG: aquaporin [Candidatus Diapherotrites archaeon]|nr:aquaporin [Candidatus Diapherotrites archaeon]
MDKNFQKYAAELIGTFTLVFIGAGAVIVNSITGDALGLLGIAFAHGLALMAMVYAFGAISGTHINPAVTIAMLAAKKIGQKDAIFFIASQLAGSIIASFALLAVFPKVPQSIALGTTMLNEVFGITFAVGTLVEIILTFFLVLTIFALSFDKRNTTPLNGFAIGMVLAFSIMVGGPLTGAALNPARAFGPAIVSGFLDNQGVYWLGPIVGGVLAAILYTWIFLSEKPRKK